jgi:para-nitrobenzyl esterase
MNSREWERTIRAAHTMDIPFALDTANMSPSMGGTGPDVQPLADKMSAAWAAFARTGDPNTEMLPDWPAFDIDTRSTMIFNNECQQANDPFSEERQAIANALANRRPRGA